jgi:hypothetical protein
MVRSGSSHPLTEISVSQSAAPSRLAATTNRYLPTMVSSQWKIAKLFRLFSHSFPHIAFLVVLTAGKSPTCTVNLFISCALLKFKGFVDKEGI